MLSFCMVVVFPRFKFEEVLFNEIFEVLLWDEKQPMDGTKDG